MTASVSLSILPTVNATLNATAATLLLAGFACIKTGRPRAHAALMSATFVVSTLFLASYLTYHINYPPTKFGGEGWIRPVYYTLLISHIMLAVAVPSMAIIAIWRAVKGRFKSHKRLTRYLLPIWLYVSVTGVTIYLMLRPYYTP